MVKASTLAKYMKELSSPTCAESMPSARACSTSTVPITDCQEMMFRKRKARNRRGASSSGPRSSSRYASSLLIPVFMVRLQERGLVDGGQRGDALQKFGFRQEWNAELLCLAVFGSARVLAGYQEGCLAGHAVHDFAACCLDS